MVSSHWKQLAVSLSAIVIMMIGVISLSGPSLAATPVPAVNAKTDHIRGDITKATVAVIEYGDLECPFCRAVQGTYKQIQQVYGDNVVWVFRQFPLANHKNAHKEAEASECVAALGGNAAFWKFVDYVYNNTTSGGTGFALDELPTAAKAAGADRVKFNTCYKSARYATLVDRQQRAGVSAGVQVTPTNFVMHLKTKKAQMIVGAQPFGAFQTEIDSMLRP